MRVLRFVIAVALAAGFVYILATPALLSPSAPPIGPFLNPLGGFWQNAESEGLSGPTELKLPGLSAPVKVVYDDNLVPHVFAQNNNDLYFAQGYLTARHRLWQLEFQTMAAAGRVSEIIGEQAIDYDRLQRRKGLYLAAETKLKAHERDFPEVAGYMQAYANGVNAYIDGLDYADLPMEYKLLDYKPEPWTPVKSLLLLQYMADLLAGWDADLENTNALKLLGRQRFDRYFPDHLPNEDPVMSRDRVWDFERLPIEKPDSLVYPDTDLALTLPKPDPANGSNNWAVGPERTQNGRTLLADDPHLPLNLPSVWFLMQLSSPDVNVYGATLPGGLGVIVGFNEDVSWGVTNATRDVRDWYKIQFRDDERREYWYDSTWLKVEQIPQEIKVKGGATVYDTILNTHLGPVVYDKYFPDAENKQNFALRWTVHDESLEQQFFMRINRAQNFTQFSKAFAYYGAPAQNFVYADRHGDIALWIGGKFAAKWVEQGKFLMPGTNSKYEWQDFIPLEQTTYEKNPVRGWVSSANQIPVDSTYPYYTYDGNYEHNRNRRINLVLGQDSLATPESMQALQMDNYNIMASEVLPA